MAHGERIFTNHRGVVMGQPLDGHLDGHSWHAWCGACIGYGATEEQAFQACRDKVDEEKRRGRAQLADIDIRRRTSVYIDNAEGVIDKCGYDPYIERYGPREWWVEVEGHSIPSPYKTKKEACAAVDNLIESWKARLAETKLDRRPDWHSAESWEEYLQWLESRS